MIKEIFPVGLKVDKIAYYRDKRIGSPNVKWFKASLGMKIKPRSSIAIDDFYIELNVGDRMEEVRHLFFILTDKYDHEPTIVMVGRNYHLSPNNPISSEFTFEFMTRNEEKIGEKAFIVLKANMRGNKFPIKKRFTLKEQA